MKSYVVVAYHDGGEEIIVYGVYIDEVKAKSIAYDLNEDDDELRYKVIQTEIKDYIKEFDTNGYRKNKSFAVYVNK